jgi:hypothetical protein
MRTTASLIRYIFSTSLAANQLAHTEDLNFSQVAARDFSDGPVDHHFRWFNE